MRIHEPISKKLLLFWVGRLSWMMDKGNVWYLRHYEQGFDEVVCCYLIGGWSRIESRGNTRLVSVGGKSALIDLFLAPWRLYRFALKYRPTTLLTADIVFGWWTTLFVRAFSGMKIVVTPVCILPDIYKSTGHSLSGMPIWLERLFVAQTFRVAQSVIMGVNSKASIDWLRSDKNAASRLKIVPCTVEEFPPADFFKRLENVRARRLQKPPDEYLKLLYVGRLHREKKIDGLVDLMVHLRNSGVKARLVIAGDGPERAVLQAAACKVGVDADIEWLGYVSNDCLPDVYGKADVFLSTVTGTALREAGLVGLAIVAYDTDWVSQLLEHENTALLVPLGDVVGMAREIARLSADSAFREEIANRFHDLALSRWSPSMLKDALHKTFDLGSY